MNYSHKENIISGMNDAFLKIMKTVF